MDEKKSVEFFGLEKIEWRFEVMEKGGEGNGKRVFLTCECGKVRIEITKHQIGEGYHRQWHSPYFSCKFC